MLVLVSAQLIIFWSFLLSEKLTLQIICHRIRFLTMDEYPWYRLLPSELFPGSTVPHQVATRPLRSVQISQTTGNFSEQQHNHEEPRQHPQIQLGLRLSQAPLQTTRAYRAQELADNTIKGFRYLHTWRTLTNNKQLAANRRITDLNANAESRYMNITQHDVSTWPTLSDLYQYLRAFDDFFSLGLSRSGSGSTCSTTIFLAMEVRPLV